MVTNLVNSPSTKFHENMSTVLKLLYADTDSHTDKCGKLTGTVFKLAAVNMSKTPDSWHRLKKGALRIWSRNANHYTNRTSYSLHYCYYYGAGAQGNPCTATIQIYCASPSEF
jgi:hypothetical protein